MINKTLTVAVFGSSLPKPGDPEYQTAYEVGKVLAQAGFAICNGGYSGTMEASACGAKESGGLTIGVVAKFFSTTANSYIDKKIVVETLVDRLMKLIELGDAYVVLRGGTGTLVELALVWEFMNKGVIRQKPIVVVGTFWIPVVDTLKTEFLSEGLHSQAEYVTIVATPEECRTVLLKRFST